MMSDDVERLLELAAEKL